MDNKEMPIEKVVSKIVSLLFVSGEPQSGKKIAKIIGVTEEEVVTALKDLVSSQPLPGLKIIEMKENFQLVTDPENAEQVKKIQRSAEEETLGSGSLEVLSVIIYQGPITKGEIELIRGINSSQALRNLMMKGLIEEEKISGVPKYRASMQLLRSLGVTKLDEIPDYEAIRNDERIKNFLNRAINDSVDDQRE